MHIRYINATLKAQLYRLLLVVNLLAAFGPCFGTITISPVNTTSSTCPNNGTATIHATSNLSNAILYYAIGPDYVWRNDSTFTSLYPGTYTARVYDLNSADSAQVSFTITGNYQLPYFTTNITPALCSGGANGVIVCNADSTKGQLPFTWQITSPLQTNSQSNNIFDSLAANTYTIRLTDACQNIQTRSAIVNTTNTGLALSNLKPYYTMLSCSTVRVRMYFKMDVAFAAFPVKLQITANSGTSITEMVPQPYATQNAGINTYSVSGIVSGVTYGDLIHVCIIDTCNVQICDSQTYIPDYSFQTNLSLTSINCLPVYYISFRSTQFSTNVPQHVVVRDSNTVIIDTFFTGNTSPDYGPLDIGGLFFILIEDSCGNFMSANQTTVSGILPPILLISPICFGGALDSTAGYRFQMFRFSSPIKIVVLSGPSVASSSSLQFAYHDTIIYPRTIVENYTYTNLYLYNLPLGTYHVRVSDSCGHAIDTFFTVSAVLGKQINSNYVLGCNGNTTWIHNIHSGCGSISLITYKVPPGTSVPVTNSPNSNIYIAQNLQPGTYIAHAIGGASSLNDFALVGPLTWSFSDTLVVSERTNELIKSHTVINCHGNIYLHIQPDSTNGIPPFKYEIINGPQTFALQNSGLFQLPTIGTYLARIIDSCGNSNTVQVKADTAYVEPIVETGNLCIGNTIKLMAHHSPYYKYIWRRPSGSTYVGDTLTIQPFSMSDTGNYLIKKVVYINNCTDTFPIIYHLNQQDISYRSDTLCEGSILHIGNYSYSQPGLYVDTLLNQTGCDSLVFIALSVNPSPLVAITPANPSVCYGRDTILTASGGITYLWSNGNTNPTLNTGNLFINSTFIVTATDANGCTSAQTSTLTVHHPQPAITASKTFLCFTDTASICINNTNFATYNWSTGAADSCIKVGAAGSYQVSVSDSVGCTAQSNTLVITSSSLQSANISASNNPICATDSAQLCAPAGLAGYLWNNGSTQRCIWVSQAGNYYVTVTNSSGCSVESNHLAIDVLPSPQVSISISRDTLTSYSAQAYQWYLNGSPISGATNEQYVVTQPGNYQVQVTDTNGCSSISNQVVFTGMPGSLLYSEALLYPNPSNGLFTVSISSPQPEKVQLRITNLLGELTGQYEFEKTSGTFNKQINLSTVPKGLYILQISIAGKILNRKIEID